MTKSRIGRVVGTVLVVAVASACGSKEVRSVDDREVTQEQTQQLDQQNQILQQGIRAQQENMQKLLQMRNQQGEEQPAPSE